MGFDFVGVLGHRTGIDALKVFLADCDEVGVRACVTQLSRKYGLAASAMADLLRGQPALILFNPVDETGQPNVYPLVDAAQHRLPHIPCFVNENTAGYQAFSSQLRGFPGPILSCDRYPLIGQPYGWPQTSADVNGIYSFEERIAWMDLNWDDDFAAVQLPLADLGIPLAACTCGDVWRGGEPAAFTAGQPLQLGPHTCRLLQFVTRTAL